jgi:Holliday junction resolvase RusA-like endonuclease
MASYGAAVDLISSDEELVEPSDEELVEPDTTAQVLNMWIPMPASAKKSVSCGPGRGKGKGRGGSRGRGGGPGRGSGSGGGGQNRFFTDAKTRKKMKEFRAMVKAAVDQIGFQPFTRYRPLALQVWCFMERPITDFSSRVRVAGKLRSSALAMDQTVLAIKPDTDNLAKFVLDCLNGVLFDDDAQIVDLHMLKLRDSEGTCEGRVAIHLRQFSGEDFMEIMPSF